MKKHTTILKGLYKSNTSFSLNNIVGIGKNIKEQAKKAANCVLPVLIQGDSGVGKEILAQAIHFESQRKNNPFVSVNCGAIPEELFENELFGHEAGAFTGAYKGGKKGKFEIAHRGTLFLDEIGDLPLSVQGKLLRVLDSGEVWRLGSEKLKKVDVRVISATHRDLSQYVKRGKFREDLYFRLCGFHLELPTLKDRMEYLEEFINHFVRKWSDEDVEFTDSALELLRRYPWPGNIRELEMTVRSMLDFCNNGIIDSFDLPEKIFSYSKTDKTLKERLSEFEEKEIRKALLRNNGNISRTAKELGFSRYGLQKKIKKYRVSM